VADIPAWIIEQERKRREKEWQPEPLQISIEEPPQLSSSIDLPKTSIITIEL